MNRKMLTRFAAVVLTAIALFACGTSVNTGNGGNGSTGGGSGTGAPYDACATDADCAWGEIDHEIITSSDCICLFGCPYIPLSKATVERRQMQYQTLCTPGQDGQGNPCPIDDCAGPPQIQCQAGHCAAVMTP